MQMQADAFETILADYEMVALIANSEAVDIDAITRSMPARTLYVFFTGCAKVLSRPFEHDAVLCHRLVAGGTRFLKSKKHFDRAYSLFSKPLKAEVGMLASPGVPDGTPPLPAARSSTLVPYTLDFDYTLGHIYPVKRVPTTGFAMAMWIAETMPTAQVCLCGFTGVASLNLSMYAEHDWTWEQILLQLFVKKGRILRFEDALSEAAGSYARIHARFPEFSEATVALVASNVLTNRFTGMERQMAKLWGMTKLQRRVRGFLRRLGNRLKRFKR